MCCDKYREHGRVITASAFWNQSVATQHLSDALRRSQPPHIVLGHQYLNRSYVSSATRRSDREITQPWVCVTAHLTVFLSLILSFFFLSEGTPLISLWKFRVQTDINKRTTESGLLDAPLCLFYPSWKRILTPYVCNYQNMTHFY